MPQKSPSLREGSVFGCLFAVYTNPSAGSAVPGSEDAVESVTVRRPIRRHTDRQTINHFTLSIRRALPGTGTLQAIHQLMPRGDVRVVG